MENNKKVVELSDDAMGMVSGGLIVNPDCVIDEAARKIYPIDPAKWGEIFGFVSQLGSVSEQEKIDALRAAGYIS